MNSTGSWWAFISISNVSPTTWLPVGRRWWRWRRPREGTRASGRTGCSSPPAVISVPSGRNQARSLSSESQMCCAPEEAPPLQHRLLVPQLDQPPRELEQRLPPLVEVPVQPGELVVLAVGVVVALLGAADLVAGEQHRHALRDEQRGEEVALLPLAQRVDLRVVGLALDAAVPGVVVVGAVPVVLAVRLVVLLVVGDQVVQGEAVVGGDEVDAGVRLAARELEQVRGAGEPVADLRGQAVVALPVLRMVSRYLPFHSDQSPGSRQLVAASAHVPRLGDELHAESTGSWWMAWKKRRVRSKVASCRARASSPGRSGTRRRASPRTQ